MFTIIRVKVRRNMVIKIHANDDPKKTADFWHWNVPMMKLYANYLGHSLADFQYPILAWEDGSASLTM